MTPILSTSWTRAAAVAVACAAALAFAACGGGGSSTPTPTPTPNPTPPPAGGTTITITATGVSPREITVPAGTRVTFVNNDTRTHEMNSDPHPEHTQCPAINAVSFMSVGQTKLTDALGTPRTCGFHDHNQPSVTSLQGIIRVQ